eukprot:5797695-Prorocentrum_lima.AAC.1
MSAETRTSVVQTRANADIARFRLMQTRGNNVTCNVSQHGEYARCFLLIRIRGFGISPGIG